MDALESRAELVVLVLAEAEAMAATGEKFWFILWM